VTTSPAQDSGDHRFLMGLIAGTVLGAGLGMLLAPRSVVEYRTRLAGSAKSLGRTASGRYQQASARVSAAAREVTSKGQALRDSLAETVVRGAQTVERYAQEAKTDRGREAPGHPVT